MVLDAVSRHRKRVLSLRSFQEHIMEARTDYREGSEVAEAPFAALRDLPTVRECQRLLIEEAMRRANGNQGVAAQLVSLSRTGLNKALKRIQTREESQKG
jgi:transcriptional regulator with GAF, ATPase, and Fis domain